MGKLGGGDSGSSGNLDLQIMKQDAASRAAATQAQINALKGMQGQRRGMQMEAIGDREKILNQIKKERKTLEKKSKAEIANIEKGIAETKKAEEEEAARLAITGPGFELGSSLVSAPQAIQSFAKSTKVDVPKLQDVFSLEDLLNRSTQQSGTRGQSNVLVSQPQVALGGLA